MDFSVEFWIQIIVLVGGMGVIWGGQKQSIFYVKESIKDLKEKQEKHNDMIERIALTESSARSAHKRIDRIERNCKMEKQYNDYYEEAKK